MSEVPFQPNQHLNQVREFYFHYNLPILNKFCQKLIHKTKFKGHFEASFSDFLPQSQQNPF